MRLFCYTSMKLTAIGVALPDHDVPISAGGVLCSPYIVMHRDPNGRVANGDTSMDCWNGSSA